MCVVFDGAEGGGGVVSEDCVPFVFTSSMLRLFPAPNATLQHVYFP